MLDRDPTGDGRINIDYLEWQYLDGNGDFPMQKLWPNRYMTSMPPHT